MKLESLKMKPQSLKKQVNNKKGSKIKGKITKSYITFSENKPNSPIVQMNASLFITMNYTIFTSLTGVKNKPKQTQFKPKTKPIVEKQKMNVNIYYTKEYNNITAFRRKKTNPKQTQFKPNQACPRMSLSGGQFQTGVSAHGQQKVQIIFDLAVGV